MSLESELAEVLARHGAPTGVAVDAANDFVARWRRRLDRWNRDSEIRRNYTGRNIAELGERIGLGRAMLYRIVKNRLLENTASRQIPDNV